MPVKKLVSFPIIQPNLQISFYFRLQIVRDLYLQNALKKTVNKLDIKNLDNELANYVSPDKLRHVAAFGLRGEVFFPIPCILEENPFLLGYYRLLFGLSQKEFYNKAQPVKVDFLGYGFKIDSNIEFDASDSACGSCSTSGGCGE